MSACPQCGAELETPLACGGCGAVFAAEAQDTKEGSSLGPFEAFGLEPSYHLAEVDGVEGKKVLRKRLVRFSRLVHPDFHGTSDPAAQGRAEAASALLNRSFEILSDDFERANCLLELLGGPSESEQRSMPQAFLMEVLEWNEALEGAGDAAPGSSERRALDGLRQELESQREALFATIAADLTPLPPPGDPKLTALRQNLNAARYIDRALSQIQDLELAQ